MDVLTLGNKKYIKASSIARTLGYTADYVGQLCRSGKVEATLVGRSWYVLEDSLLVHKQDRYRTSQVKSKKQIVKTVHAHKNNKREPLVESNFYKHVGAHHVAMAYHHDTTELLPKVNKKTAIQHTIPVHLGDAKALTVSDSHEDLVFQTPALPKIKFKGTLIVSELSDEHLSAPDGGRLIHPTQTQVLNSYKTHKNKVIPSKRVFLKKNIQPVHPQVFGSEHETHIKYIHEEASVKESATKYGKIFSLLLILASILVAGSFFILEYKIIATSTEISQTLQVTSTPLDVDYFSNFFELLK